jgi:thiamine biosynthesis protein ThiS
MFVIVNGETRPLPEPRTLTALLISLSLQVPFAVAHNEEFVPRGDYEDAAFLQATESISFIPQQEVDI